MAVHGCGLDHGDDRVGRRDAADGVGPVHHGVGPGIGCAAAAVRWRVEQTVRPVQRHSAIRAAASRHGSGRIQVDFLAGVGASCMGPANRRGVLPAAGVLRRHRRHLAPADTQAGPAVRARWAAGRGGLVHGRLRLRRRRHRRVALPPGGAPDLGALPVRRRAVDGAVHPRAGRNVDTRCRRAASSGACHRRSGRGHHRCRRLHRRAACGAGL